MEGSGTFDKLVAELSIGERRELLSRLRSQDAVSETPLFSAGDLPAKVELERRFSECPWYYRLFLSFLGIFKNKPPLRVFEDRLLGKLGAKIETHSPGLYNHRHSLLLGGFHEELRSLKESARFFYDALDGSVVRDKGSFFAFLASLELDFIHRRLSTEADPFSYAATNSQATESDIRQATSHALEAILQSIDEDQRALMYRNVRSLLCLKELASFLFDRALSAFSFNADGQEPTCPAYLLQDQLSSLNNVLFSLEFPPSLTLLESLFVFDLQDRVDEDGFDLIAETRTLLLRAEEALSRIREFNQRVPLTAIVRCTTKNLEYLPHSITGGEDWFAVYRDFWRKHQEQAFASLIKGRRRDQLSEGIGAFLKGKTPPRLEYAASAANPDAIPVHSSFAISFLAAFHRIIFVEEINKPLKTILIDGEFYRRENRSEFTEAYNEILKLGDAICFFDSKLAPAGDLGKRYDFARAEVTALPAKRRKLQLVMQEADAEAQAIISNAMKSLRTLANVLGGVVGEETGGRYDSLANIGGLTARNGSLLPSLRNAVQKIEKTIQMMGDIESMESGR
jgi:hypothetical protein